MLSSKKCLFLSDEMFVPGMFLPIQNSNVSEWKERGGVSERNRREAQVVSTQLDHNTHTNPQSALIQIFLSGHRYQHEVVMVLAYITYS